MGYTVEVFYWPDPNADKSCLSIVEDTAYPLDMGATVGQQSETYWACTLRTPTTGESIVTTASLEVYSQTTLKVHMVNPWHPQDCFNVSIPHAVPQIRTVSPKVNKLHQTGYAIDTQPSITRADNIIATAVLDGYTLYVFYCRSESQPDH